MHSAGSGRGPTALRSNRRSASNSAYASRRPRPLLRDLADAAPRARHHLEHLGDQRLRGPVALLADHARVLVLDLGAALLELLHAQVDALQDVERLEAGDDDRHAGSCAAIGRYSA